jgi:hypothetical protein
VRLVKRERADDDAQSFKGFRGVVRTAFAGDHALDVALER